MAEEEKDQSEETEAAEEQAEAPAAEAPAAEEEAPAEEAPAAEEAAPAAEVPAEREAAGGDEEPAAELTPKQRRKLARSTHEGEPNPPLSADERVERRAAERRRKAGERRRYRQGRGAARAKAAGKGSGTGTEPAPLEPGSPKVRQGIVVSDKMDKTITVRVESARRHPSYEKVIRTSKMYHAHDERNEAGAGDTVRLIETRPMSKTKRWRLTEILEKAK